MRNRKIWTVANQKGGVGKSTTSITMGGILAQSGLRTLLIDLDPQGSMTSYFGYDPEDTTRGVYRLFEEITSPTIFEQHVSRTNFLNLHILTACTAMATLERKLSGKNGMGLILQRAFQSFKNTFDYVIIDCAPSMGVLMINALAACDHLIIPVQTELLAMKGLENMVRSIKMINQARRKNLNYTIIPTMFDQRTRACHQVLEMLRAKYTDRLSGAVIPIDTQFRDACFAGTPLSFLSMRARGVVAYQELMNYVESCCNIAPLQESTQEA